MDIKLVDALLPVKIAMLDASDRASRRRLTVLPNSPCKSGCASCCSRMIFITVAEALLIRDQLVQNKQWKAVRDRILQIPAALLHASPQAWFKINQACPVLDPETRKCLAYESRPTPCSTHFVISDAKACDPWDLSGTPYIPAPMDDLHDEFVRKLESHLDGHGILSVKLPLPAALLLADRIHMRTGLTLDRVISLIFNEFA